MSSGETVRAEILYLVGAGSGFSEICKKRSRTLWSGCNPINLRDGRVFVLAEEGSALELLINELRKGPTFAHVEDVDVTLLKPWEMCMSFPHKFMRFHDMI